MMLQQVDKAGHDYWNRNWEQVNIPTAFDPYDQSLDNTFYVRLHEFFSDMMKKKKEWTILEIGCAHSVWPEYFTRYHGAYVDGLDYSEIGCIKTREMWKERELSGQIVCADMFSPPKDMLEKYDAVVSFGVVEHFEDTAFCLKACSRFVKPGGIVMTLIPNMAGLNGWLQRHVDQDVYNIHVPLTLSDLVNAHEKAELEIEHASYFMSINMDVVNSGRHTGKPIDKFMRRLLSLPSKTIWSIEKAGLRFPVNRITSPSIITIARI